MISVDPAPVSYDVEVTVDEHLVDELVRNGVPRGRRVRMHLELVPDTPARQEGGWASFIGMIDSGEPDLAERSAEILRQELIGVGGLQPGVDLASNVSVREAMDEGMSVDALR